MPAKPILKSALSGLLTLAAASFTLSASGVSAAISVDIVDQIIGLQPASPVSDHNADGVVDAADLVVPELVSLAITSNVTAPVHQSATQTLTFTFAQSVTGFDATDVTVAGATKGAFSGTDAVYTLAVTGPGGRIDVAVTQSVTSLGNDAANFSNFYQDTWTLTLPGAVPMELIRIPAGTFMMGSPPEELSRLSDETQHTVTLSQDFYLGKTEVTQNQFAAIQSFPAPQSFVGGTMPVHRVSHNDVQTWLAALNTETTEPGTFGLPTESQWEYAARAGTTTRFNFGDGFASNETSDIAGGRGDNMWFTGNNSSTGTKTVGQKPANAWGLRDMHGNVWEWCADWYGTYPEIVTDPLGSVGGSDRVFRGGGWSEGAQDCRSAFRNGIAPAFRSSNVGFRVLAVRPAAPMPLAITRSESAPVHQSATHTLIVRSPNHLAREKLPSMR